jgi:hypothetical protein
MNTWMRRSSDAFTSHGSAGEFKFDRNVPAHPESVHDSLQQSADIHACPQLCRQLRVDHRDLADAGQQRFHPRDLQLHHAQKAATLLLLVDLGQHLRRGSDRRQRILELVRDDVGGERLDESHMLVEPPRFLLQRAPLQSEEFLLVRAEVEDSGDRQKNEQQIERHQPKRDAREKTADAIGDPLHGSPRSAAGSAAGPQRLCWRYVGHATHR